MRRRTLLEDTGVVYVTLTITVNANVKQIDVTVDGTTTRYTKSTTVQVPIGATVSWTATANTGYKLSASSGNFGQMTEDKTIAPTASVTTYTLTITKNSGVKSITVTIGTAAAQTFTSSATKSVDHGTKVTWTATAENGLVMDTASDTISSMTSDKTISPTVNFVWDGQPTVDLGLSSGTIWQTYNLGASKPEEYGLYYAWADTKGYAKASDKSGGFMLNVGPYWVSGTLGQSSKWSKYTASDSYSSTGVADNKTTLENSDDAAYAASGGKYRMPTTTQIKELANTSNCNNYWVKCNGVYGMVFISKKNSKGIFFPAAGCIDGSSIKSVGSWGYVWSSSLDTSYSYCAYALRFSSSSVNSAYDDSRWDGLPVRGVVA